MQWTSRKRVEAAIRFEEPDRVPIDLTITTKPYSQRLHGSHTAPRGPGSAGHRSNICQAEKATQLAGATAPGGWFNYG
jgi:hypothetical protein